MGRLVIAGLAAAAAFPALAFAGSIDRGRQIYDKQCLVCHAVEAEFHKEGPSLSGVYGRRAGTAPFFPYKALKGSTVVWTETSLDAWLADPRGFVDGRNTGMTVRLEDAGQRADVIAYMKSLR